MATLLIVDDDNNIRDTLCDFFLNKHECHTADRAEQALAFLEFETYDAVVTDIAMPGLSGRDLLRRMQLSHPTTPVIVMSGSDGEETSTLLDMGAFAYLTKPFKLDEMEAAVNRAVAQSQAIRSESEAHEPDPDIGNS